MAAGDLITIWVIVPPKRGRFHAPGDGPPQRIRIDGCLFAPGPSRELGEAAATVVSDGTVYAPPGPAADVQPEHRVEVLGDEYAVVGKPQPWGSEGVVIVLRQTTG